MSFCKFCEYQSCIPKQETTPPMPETKPYAKNACCVTYDDTTISQMIEEMNKTLIIQCKRIVLQQDGIGIDVDVPKGFDKIDTIMINGVRFVKNNGEI